MCLEIFCITKYSIRSLGEIGFLITSRSVGYVVGSIVAGPIFDKFNGNIVVSGSLLFTAIGTKLNQSV